MNKYAEIILPLPLDKTFTYEVPYDYQRVVDVGYRVVVPFGAKKFYTGIVCSMHDIEPQGYDVKSIEYVLDDKPIVNNVQIELWQWIASYYMCAVGEVYKAALPSGLKVESETVVELNEDYGGENCFTEKENKVLLWLQAKGKSKVNDIFKNVDIKAPLSVVKSLLEKEIIKVTEELKESYRPKTEVMVKLAEGITEQGLNVLLGSMNRSPRQRDLILSYLNLSALFSSGTVREVSKKHLLDATACSSSVFTSLVERGIITTYLNKISRLDDEITEIRLNTLNPHQQLAFEQINTSFESKDVCLLNGVTSSGKTEIYIHLINKVLNEGKQVLYLLPEIALTTQITHRLKRVFGNRLGVYHSKFPDAERIEVWKKQLSDAPYDVILGVRSSVFLPFSRLGLIIVDEEHEATYKQQEPAPRYNAKNTAIVLAQRYANAKVLLGSATPSVESFYNAKQGKYGLVSLSVRHEGVELPHISPIDIKELYRKKRMRGMFSPDLVEAMSSAIERKEQVILFQNRRGFAPMLECKTCGWTPRCSHCDVSLTYHKKINKLTCHYCGETYNVPTFCPACESTKIVDLGAGTEKIEEEVSQLFPSARVVRMDMDTAKTKNSYERIISDFADKKADVLIGTQMVSKGLDFDNVSLVGIVYADGMLNFPDFRAHERAFQLMSQVAGRAGRRQKQGRVLLQTKKIDNNIIPQIVENDYIGMLSKELSDRKMLNYPPFSRLIYIYIKHRDESVADDFARQMSASLRQSLGSCVLGASKPVVSRVQSLFIRTIVIKAPIIGSLNQLKEYLKQMEMFYSENNPKFKSVKVYYDVDPV